MKLTIFTLGRFNIVRDGQPLRFSSKKPRVPLNLLKALIAFGGRNVPVERLCDALWPDSEGNAAAQALATTLSRLRELVGASTIRRHGSQLTLDSETCWVDCWVLERLLNSSAQREPALFPEVVRLYQGPFLDSEDDVGWLIPTRSRLHARLVRFFESCARTLEEAGRYNDALDVLLRGLEIDRTNEELVRGLVRAYEALDRRVDGVVAYNRWYTTLKRLADVEPSPRTRQTYQSLLGPQVSS